jgi:outer membrane lipoprotein-sorting protein
MTEDQLRSALADYAEPLRYHPPVPHRRRFPVRLVAIGVTCLLAGVIVVGVLAPRPSSAAATLDRMQRAISDVKTMRAEMTVLDPKTGKEQPTWLRYWYRDGQWRMHGRIGRFHERIVLIRDNRQYDYLPQKHVVTYEDVPPADNWEFKGGTALDFAMSQVNNGQTDLPRESRVEPGPNGIDHLILERKEDSYRCIIEIDRRTGLPIRARSTVYREMKDDRQTTVHRFHFGEALDSRLFDPKAFEAPIIDLAATQAKFRQTWEPPLAAASGTAIRDAAVNADGMVFVTVSIRTGSPMPDTLKDAHGTVYLRLQDMAPGGTRGDTHARQTAPYVGGRLYTTVWIPLEPSARPPLDVRVGLSRRSPDARPAAEGRPFLIADLPIRLRRLKGEFPEHGTAFVMSSQEDLLTVSAARLRAETYAKRNDTEEELRWLRVVAQETRKRVPRWGIEKAEALAKRYRALGRESDAHEVEREFGLRAKAELP